MRERVETLCRSDRIACGDLRSALRLATTVILTACASWVYPRAHSSNAPPVMPHGQPYIVGTAGDEAEFDLDFSPECRYVAVIGSLGPSSRSFEVGCSANACHRGQSAARNCLTAYEPIERELSRDQGAVTPAVSAVPLPRAVSAPPGEESTPRPSRVATSARTFALPVTGGSLDDPRHYATIRAHTVAERREVCVYLDDQQSARELAPGLAQTVAEILDEDVIPACGNCWVRTATSIMMAGSRCS